ncbi:MAG: Wzt carbohydrate-binding domain-containing protein [Bryobacteraceae bacterium]
MALAFKKVTQPPVVGFTANAPDGVVVGVIGEDGCGADTLLRVGAGAQKPTSGSVSGSKSRRLLGPEDALDFSPTDVLLMDHTFARLDSASKARGMLMLDRLRKTGTTVMIASHDENLLSRLCDEVWWLQDGKLVARGDAETTLAKYRHHVADRLRQWGETLPGPVVAQERRGDERAEILNIETIGAQGRPTAVWRSGELAEVRLAVRYKAAVPDPVIGILLRNRVGLDVYGTNTQLEGLRLGPCAEGQTVRLSFHFHCDLCPGDYTLTIASHDPDGSRHDWLDDAVAISVTDDRFTAGVANLRARVTIG